MTCSHPSHACDSLGTPSSTLPSHGAALLLPQCPSGKSHPESSHSHTTMGESTWNCGAKPQHSHQTLLIHQGMALRAAGR